MDLCVCVCHLLVDNLQSVFSEMRAEPFRGSGRRVDEERTGDALSVKQGQQAAFS